MGFKCVCVFVCVGGEYSGPNGASYDVCAAGVCVCVCVCVCVEEGGGYSGANGASWSAYGESVVRMCV